LSTTFSKIIEKEGRQPTPLSSKRRAIALLFFHINIGKGVVYD
jgi:hypothetical protein